MSMGLEINDLRKKYSVDGICSASPKIEIEGKIFCFTGSSEKASRKEIAANIQKHGGVLHTFCYTKNRLFNCRK